MIARVTNKNKVLPMGWKERETRYVKIICIAGIMDQGRMSFLWEREVTWKMKELVVYEPDIETFVGLVDQHCW